MPQTSNLPAVVLGVCVAALSAAALAYLVWEMAARETVGGVDDPGGLLWADLFAAAAAASAGGMVLLGNSRRTAAFLLLTAAIASSVTSRVRDLNVRTDPDEAYACGRREAVDACPTQRVQISAAFQEWREGNEDAKVCWLNTSAELPETFVWGRRYANATNLPTSDFAGRAVYELHPKYAPCFYWGCSAACLPEQRAHNERLLRFETLATVVAFVGVAFVLCVRSPRRELLEL